MARILSISYEETLLHTRQMLLEQQGHNVISALGFSEGVTHCEQGGFDLLLLGHSIPLPDKEKVVETFRRHCSAPILSLRRMGEAHLADADYVVFSHDPHEMLERVSAILDTEPQSAPE